MKLIGNEMGSGRIVNKILGDNGNRKMWHHRKIDRKQSNGQKKLRR